MPEEGRNPRIDKIEPVEFSLVVKLQLFPVLNIHRFQLRNRKGLPLSESCPEKEGVRRKLSPSGVQLFKTLSTIADKEDRGAFFHKNLIGFGLFGYFFNESAALPAVPFGRFTETERTTHRLEHSIGVISERVSACPAFGGIAA
jgi:hypothetical protein